MVRARRKKVDPEKKRWFEEMTEMVYGYFEDVDDAFKSYDETKVINALFSLFGMSIGSLVVSHRDVIEKKRTEEQVLDELFTMLKKETMERIRKYNHDQEGNEEILN